MRIQRAIISVYDKSRVEEFAQVLLKLGVEILSSGGTARYLREHDIPVREISEYTGAPEILDGRVKTIHPKIEGGILARRDRPEHLRQLEEQGILPIDMVVVNLYPFVEALADSGKTDEEMLELIDIGGPTMIRAAAKNYPFVAVVCDPEQYDRIAAELLRNGGELSEETHLALARTAFEKTAFYDASIAAYLAGKQEQETPAGLAPQMLLPLLRTQELRYGENPHQRAGFYRPAAAGRERMVEQLHGIELSYNNTLDADAAIHTVSDFGVPAVAILKHTNPCGVGSAGNLVEAYEKALATDPVSAFGGILAVNRTFSAGLAEAVRDRFWEVILAPDYEEEALAILKKKKKLRILKFFPKSINEAVLSLRTALDGFLVQEADRHILPEEGIRVVSERQPTPEELEALLFNWRVVKHVKSNAIVFGARDRTLGIGAGQMSRVDSVELAVKKAEKAGLSLKGSVLASDAFFPFRDGIDAAAAAGATAVIQPGGSIRDKEVIAAANEHGMAMVFTGMRHFRH